MKTKKIKIYTAAVLVILAVGGSFLLTKRTRAPALTIPTKTTQKTIATQPNKPAAGFNKTAYSLDDSSSKWVVINKSRPIQPIAYTPSDLTSVGGGQAMRKEAADAFVRLQADAKQIGLTISALSGFRAYNTQVNVYNNEVKNFGKAKADSESARPGTSEHQTGWAVDVGGGGCGIEDCFGTTAEGTWLSAHCHEYGFIIRYTTEKQPITGYRAEPWHIRYIGAALSQEMHKEAVTTLEEFFGLPAAPDYPTT